MGKYIIRLTEEEEKALLTNVTSIQEWIENAIKNKARQCIDEVVEKSGLGSKFSSVERKIQIIRQLVEENSPLLKTAVEKGDELVRV